jgi:hypothetical protein
MAQLNFDASQVDPQQSLEPLPTGWYNCVIDNSEIKPTKDGTGAYLSLSFRVLDGDCAGRKVYTNLNIQNKNMVAQEIAFKQLSAICHAVGVIQCPQSELLHDKPLQLRVTLQPPKDGYDASNNVKAFKAIEDGGMQPVQTPWNPQPGQVAQQPVQTPWNPQPQVAQQPVQTPWNPQPGQVAQQPVQTPWNPQPQVAQQPVQTPWNPQPGQVAQQPVQTPWNPQPQVAQQPTEVQAQPGQVAQQPTEAQPPPIAADPPWAQQPV